MPHSTNSHVASVNCSMLRPRLNSSPVPRTNLQHASNRMPHGRGNAANLLSDAHRPWSPNNPVEAKLTQDRLSEVDAMNKSMPLVWCDAARRDAHFCRYCLESALRQAGVDVESY